MARPNVLMFGDAGWKDDRRQEQGCRQDSWLARTRRPVVVEIGAGEAIPSVRNFSESMTRDCGATLIRINPVTPRVPRKADLALPLGGLEALLGINTYLRLGASDQLQRQ